MRVHPETHVSGMDDSCRSKTFLSSRSLSLKRPGLIGIENRIQVRCNGITDFGTGHPGAHVSSVGAIRMWGDADAVFDVDDRHDRARVSRRVRAGAMIRPAGMVADFAEIKAVVVHRQIPLAQHLLN